jgi:hypothetical protein
VELLKEQPPAARQLPGSVGWPRLQQALVAAFAGLARALRGSQSAVPHMALETVAAPVLAQLVVSSEQPELRRQAAVALRAVGVADEALDKLQAGAAAAVRAHLGEAGAGAAGGGKAAPSCAVCGAAECADGSVLKRCRGCLVTRYCGRDCQVANWKAHRQECKERAAAAAAAGAAQQ